MVCEGIVSDWRTGAGSDAKVEALRPKGNMVLETEQSLTRRKLSEQEGRTVGPVWGRNCAEGRRGVGGKARKGPGTDDVRSARSLGVLRRVGISLERTSFLSWWPCDDARLH